MKLLIIRHGDPNYDIDSLTPKGWKEVAYLSERIARLDTVIFTFHRMDAQRIPHLLP